MANGCLKFKRLLQRVDFDEEILRDPDGDAVAALEDAEHFELFDCLEPARRHGGKRLQEVGPIGIEPEVNEHRTARRRFAVKRPVGIPEVGNGRPRKIDGVPVLITDQLDVIGIEVVCRAGQGRSQGGHGHIPCDQSCQLADLFPRNGRFVSLHVDYIFRAHRPVGFGNAVGPTRVSRIGHERLIAGILQQLQEDLTVDGKVEGKLGCLGADTLGRPEQHRFPEDLVEQFPGKPRRREPSGNDDGMFHRSTDLMRASRSAISSRDQPSLICMQRVRPMIPSERGSERSVRPLSHSALCTAKSPGLRSCLM